jgi:hypothetical protein
MASAGFTSANWTIRANPQGVMFVSFVKKVSIPDYLHIYIYIYMDKLSTRRNGIWKMGKKKKKKEEQ